MTQEQWIQWEPVPGLARKYDIDTISYTVEHGFIMLLAPYSNSNSDSVRVIFKQGIDAHRETDESYRLRTISYLNNRNGSNFCAAWTFFKAIDSSYIQWLSSESLTLTDRMNLTHFIFAGANSIVDVVTTYEPIVEFLPSQE